MDQRKRYRKIGLLVFGFTLLLILPFTVFRKSVPQPRQIPLNDTIQPYAVPKDEAAALIQKASENYFYHEFKEGAENYLKAIAIYESRQDYSNMARTYRSLGDLYLWAQDPEKAEQSYTEAANYHMQTRDAQGQANDLMQIGEIYRKSKQHDTAEQWYQKSLMALEGTGMNRVFGRVHEARGHNFWENEKVPEAKRAFAHARRAYSQLNYRLGVDHMTNVLKRLEVKQDRLDRKAARQAASAPVSSP